MKISQGSTRRPSVTSHSHWVPRRAVVVLAWQAGAQRTVAGHCVYCLFPFWSGLGYRRGGSPHACVEMLHLWGSEAEPGSLTSEVECSKFLWFLRLKASGWKTAGVMHYLLLCNKQMPFWMLWFICYVALLHCLSPKTASEQKSRIIWSISCHNTGKDDCLVCVWMGWEVWANLPAPSVLLFMHEKAHFFPTN